MARGLAVLGSVGLVVLGLLIGCAVRTEVKTEDLSTLKGDTRFDRVLFRTFTAAPAAAPPPLLLRRTRESAIEYLRLRAILGKVDEFREGEGTDGAAIVDGYLTELRIPSGAARFWVGPMAGRSHMKMNVKITDARTNAAIAEQELLVAPDVWVSSLAMGVQVDDEVSELMGSLIGDFVLANSRE